MSAKNLCENHLDHPDHASPANIRQPLRFSPIGKPDNRLKVLFKLFHGGTIIRLSHKIGKGLVVLDVDGFSLEGEEREVGGVDKVVFEVEPK